MKRLSLFAVLLFCSFMTLAQESKNLLKFKLLDADTVVLISYEAGTDGIKKPLVTEGKINRGVIKEQKTIKKSSLDSLISILNRPFQDLVPSEHGCFEPHHAILIIKNNKTSYIEICFGCENYKTSADLGEISSFDSRKWRELYNYFTRQGFKYEMKK